MLSSGYLSFWDDLPMPVRWAVYTLFMGYLILKRRGRGQMQQEPDSDCDD